MESHDEREQLLKKESLSKMSEKSEKTFRKKSNNFLLEQDFAKTLMV